jgi:hypothetical protein
MGEAFWPLPFLFPEVGASNLWVKSPVVAKCRVIAKVHRSRHGESGASLTV